MKIILFKDKRCIYYTSGDILFQEEIDSYVYIDLTNIPYLDETKVLYHYKHNVTGELFPVYYEHNGRFVTVRSGVGHLVFNILNSYVKDNTLNNLKLLEDGNII